MEGRSDVTRDQIDNIDRIQSQDEELLRDLRNSIELNATNIDEKIREYINEENYIRKSLEKYSDKLDDELKRLMQGELNEAINTRKNLERKKEEIDRNTNNQRTLRNRERLNRTTNEALARLNSQENDMKDKYKGVKNLSDNNKRYRKVAKNQTKEFIESINLLEQCILNPDKKINDLISENNINFNGSQTEFLILLSQFTLNKENVIVNNNDNFENRSISVASKYKDIDEMQDYISNVNVLRNNVAHGKFILNFDNLDTYFYNKNIIIKHEDFKKVITDEFVDNKIYTQGFPIKCGVALAENDIEFDINNIDNILNNYTVYDFCLNGTNTESNIDCVKEIISNIKNIKNNPKELEHEKEAFIRGIKGIKILSEYNNLDLKITNKKLIDVDPDLITKIKKIINENQETLKDSKLFTQFIKGCLNDFYYDKEPIYQIDKALSQLTRMSNYCSETRDKTYKEIKSDKLDLPPTDNQMLLATTLVKFNCLFSYNTDSIYKTDLDYSLLDLSDFNPTVNKNTSKIVTDFNTENENLFNAIEEDRQAVTRFIKYQNIPQEYYDSYKIKIYSKMFMMLDNEQTCKLSNVDYKKDIRDREMYFKNKNIIEHIRNSITHGNIIIESRIKNNNLSTCVLVFKDYNNQELTFDLRITLDKIAKLIDYEKISSLLVSDNLEKPLLICNNDEQNEEIIPYENYQEIFNNDEVIEESLGGRNYTGFTSLLFLIAITLIESFGLLFYALLKLGIIIK